MLNTATIVGGGHRSRTFLNLLANFFHSPTFLKHLSPLRAVLRLFIFAFRLLILQYIPRQFFRNETPLLQKKNTSRLNEEQLASRKFNNRSS